MRLMKCNKLIVADRVLADVKSKLKLARIETSIDDWWIDLYMNGRELGYHIKGWVSCVGDNNSMRFMCSFSENRNSDHIVVYCELGESSVFNEWGITNQPSEKAYQEAKYFPPDHESQAAAYIVQQIKKFMREVKRK